MQKTWHFSCCQFCECVPCSQGWFLLECKYLDIHCLLVRFTHHGAAQFSYFSLFPGCGNSLLSEQMYNDGFKHIINTDFSQTVIEKMAEKYKHLPEMTWKVMDIRNLTFPSSSFEVVVEKGTLDALLVHEKDPWNISTESLVQIDKILEQVKVWYSEPLL